MANLTLAVQDDLLRKARKAAQARDTTVNALVREYLEDLVRRDATDPDEIVRKLKALYKRTSVRVQQRDWNREDLHER
jgi:hypothetical protein